MLLLAPLRSSTVVGMGKFVSTDPQGGFSAKILPC